MISDSRLALSRAQAVTATALSTNVIDLGSPPTLRSLSSGAVLVLRVGDAFDQQLTITVESDSAATLDAAPTVHWSSGAILAEGLAANTVLAQIPMPPTANYQRYLAVRYTAGESEPAAGTIDAFFVLDGAVHASYADGVPA